MKNWPFYVEANGAPYVGVDLTIPKTAPAGYAYEVHPYRYDDEASDLDLTLYFQVATLKPSRSSLSRGGSVTLSGTVPTQGRWGGALGKRKTLTIFQRTTVAGQPTAWDATKKGWKKVGSVRTDGAGAFRTSALRPRRTTWYVARYPGDDWYYRAYTSVVKVAMK